MRPSNFVKHVELLLEARWCCGIMFINFTKCLYTAAKDLRL